jgi:hypothetical protein
VILFIAEWVVWMLLMAFIATQFVLPWMDARPVLPMFRRTDRTRELKAQEDLLRVGDEAVAVELESEVRARRARMARQETSTRTE